MNITIGYFDSQYKYACRSSIIRLNFHNKFNPSIQKVILVLLLCSYLPVTAAISRVGCGNGLRLGIFSINISSDPYPVRRTLRIAHVLVGPILATRVVAEPLEKKFEDLHVTKTVIRVL